MSDNSGSGAFGAAIRRMEDLHDLRRLIQRYPEQAAQFVQEAQAASSTTEGRGSADR